jgi:transposase
MRKSPKSSPEVIERAVRMVFMVFAAKDQYPSPWAAIESIAGKIGCTAETLRKWVRQGERDVGVRPGPTTAEQQRIGPVPAVAPVPTSQVKCARICSITGASGRAGWQC